MSFKLRDDDDSNKKPSPFVAGSLVGGGTGLGVGAHRVEAFLGKGSKVVGSLTFVGSVEIDGHVEGEIHAQDRLVVGESATINAKVMGSEIIVKGQVTGDIVATKRIALKAPAKIIGNVSAPAVSMEEGVAFEGKCTMIASPNASKSVDQRSQGAVKLVGAEKVGASA